MSTYRRLYLAVTIGMLLVTYSANSAFGFEISKRAQPEDRFSLVSPMDRDQFGRSVAVSGSRIVVGSPNFGSMPGGAFVFDFVNGVWQSGGALPADDVVDRQFGFSVDVFGDYAVVGSPNDTDGRGAAYFFERINNVAGERWVQVDKEFTILGGPSTPFFGRSVSIDGDRALVGADQADFFEPAPGAAVVFRRQEDGTWSEVDILLASDGANSDRFGHSVDLQGTRAVVGAFQESDSTGAAYIFDLTAFGWQEQQKLTASDGEPFDQYGIDVDLSGDRVIIGASFDDDLDLNSGAAYVHEFNGQVWQESQKLTASDGGRQSGFGMSVCIEGARAVVGSGLQRDGGGTAYLYEFASGDWAETQKLTDGEGAFGASCDMLADRLVVGAPSEDGGGAAYVFGLLSSDEVIFFGGFEP